jgi:hypothetical protein
MTFLRKRILHLSDIPSDLNSITSIDDKKEVDPQLVGMYQSDIDEIWHHVVKLYKCGVHPGISLSIRRQGKVLLSRGIGHALPCGPTHRSACTQPPKVLQPY